VRWMQKTLLATLILSAMGWTQPLPKQGQVYQTRKIDLTGDGKPDRVELVAYRIHKESDSHWGQLRVVDARGKLLWKAPQASQAQEPFAFGSWPYGNSDLEWLGDLEGDGVVDLISQRSISDLRPATYRRYRWTGKAFEVLPAKMLLESGADSGNFTWSNPFEWDGQKPLTWVMSLSGSPKLVATIYSAQSGGSGRQGQAQMIGSAAGMKVSNWLKKMAPTEQVHP
jgi:hypothetical protein